jgi:hypothetical protein
MWLRVLPGVVVLCLLFGCAVQRRTRAAPVAAISSGAATDPSSCAFRPNGFSFEERVCPRSNPAAPEARGSELRGRTIG